MRSSGPAEAVAGTTAAGEPGVPQAGGEPARTESPPAPRVDLESSSGVAMWWVTAILVYAILLFGVAVAFPFPPAGIAVALLVAEVVAAYFINRALWRRAREWSVARVRKLVVYLGAAVVVLIALGWVRRRFLG